MIIENNKPKVVCIGKWIDEYLDSGKHNVSKYDEKQANMELLDISKCGINAHIKSCDEVGKVNWHNITNITRHDPSEYVYVVKTKWGREVTVVESKSLLVWNVNKNIFEEKDSCDVKIGDKLPITIKSQVPQTTLTFVDLRDYLSPNDYLYGTEYYTQSTKTTFEIRKDHVYTKCSKNSISLKDKLELNRENGFFIGIYLAEGNTCKDYVGIANNDPYIRKIVTKWFEANDITHKTQVKPFNPKRPRLSTSIRGYSTLLVQFLESFLGKYSDGKYIPNETFMAPDDFIKGVIDGYISGDGCITDYHICVSSVSKDLIYGVSQLLTRFGIFSKISSIQQKSNNIESKNIKRRYYLSVQSNYVYKFGEVFTLSHPVKQEKLSKLCQKITLGSMSHLYETQEDVLLDPITSITKILSSSDDKYKKVYDITVPTTLNFEIFNGLTIRDTSETGYIQRKLVKAMEDCKINYDYTVRNASGSIIQFLYGDDGMDPIKIESQSLPYIDMDLQKLQKEYLLTANDDFQHLLDPEVLSSLKGNWEAPFKTHFNTILEDREFMIMQIFKGKQNNSFMYPVSFTRIINNAKAMMKRYGMSILSDLNPRYVLDTINKLSDELYISKNNKGNRFINILINAYLSPKQVMYQYKFNKDVFDYVVQQVKHRFFDAIAHPSEMVGVVAAQSIGEPCTQMSATKDTVVRITGPNEYSYVGPIGTFVDDLMNKNKEKCIEFMKDHYVLDLDTDYNVIGVSNEEKTSWKKISQISRHPANGGLVKVTTRSGRTTTATLTHSFLGRTTNGIKEVKGSDLNVGDRVPVAKYIQEVNTPKTTFEIQGIGQVQLTKDFGWFCGVYLADGHINNNTIQITKCIKEYNAKLHDIINNMFGIQVYTKEGTKSCFNKYPSKSYPFIENKFNSKPLAQFLSNNFGEGSANKYIPSWVYGSNTDFISGILQGYFDGDGNVNGTPKKSMIRVGSISKQLIQDVSVLLSYFGIFGSLCIEESRTGATNKPFYTIQISRKYANDFKDKIGFIVETKKMELEKMLEYVNRDDKHSDQEVIDKIPELGHIIAQIGKDLKLPGQSRLYGRWAKKESIGRFTLIKYIKVFEEENMSKNLGSVSKNIEILKQAAYSDVIWDEIVYLEYLDDPQEYVYDFTVPGNDSFMVDCGVLVHNTLNTFHHSGISSASKAVRGVPRIKELLSVTKNIKAPSMTIHLKEDYKKDKMKANTVVKSIQTTFFKDIVKTSKIYYDAQDFKTDIDDDALFVNSYKELMDKELIQYHDTAPWLLRIELNRDKLLEEGISMLTLYNILQDYYEDTISCMFSDDNSSNLIFRIKFIDDNSSDDDRDYITELKALEKNIMDNILIKGVKNVNKAMMNKQEYQIYDPETLQFRKTFEWVLDTSGTNMIDVMCHPHIDYTKTVSNDINEIYDLLGIEAARNALYNELSGVISDAELYVNYRHIALLVDTMTNRGYLLSIDRHGINRVDIGPLAKCSFEETTDMLIKAGIFSEVDKITGVSANIMLGQIPPCGTGDSEILIDEHKLLNNIKTTFDDTDKTDYEDVCSFDNLSFDFRLPNKNEDIDTIKDFDIKVV